MAIIGRFTKLARSVAVIVFASCVVVSSLLWWQMRETEGDAQPRYCWDALASNDIAAVSDRDELEIESQEDEFSTSGSHECLILGDEARLAAYEIYTAPRIWLYGDRSGVDRSDLYASRSPIGAGLSGWVNPTAGEVWLPRACNSEFGDSAEPVVVSVRLFDNPKERIADVDQRSKVRSMLMKVANEIARKANCIDREFESVNFQRTEIKTSNVDDGAACDMEGFSVRNNGFSGSIKQYIGGMSDDSWSCLLEYKEGSSDAKMAVFTSTRQKDIIDDFKRRNVGERVGLPRWDAAGIWRDSERGAVLLECDSGPSLVGMEYPYSGSGSVDAAKKTLRSPKDMFERYVSLVVERDSCESVKSE